MRLLWEESLLGAIGAMIVAATALGMTLLVLEGVLGIDGGVSVVLSLIAAVALLETISRRYYAGEEPEVAVVPEPGHDRAERSAGAATAVPADAAGERAA